MVTRNYAFGAGAQPRSRSSFPFTAACAALLGALGTLPLAAQEPTPAPPQEPAPAAVQQYGRLVADSTTLRCWPSTAAMPPVFEDVLAKGQVVALGRSENGFRCIVLPLGPIGYVSQKFTETAPDGTVKTKGSKVAFRYRPRSTEAPVMGLEDGTALHVIAEQPDWLQVRVPSIEAWVTEAEVQLGDPADATLAAAYAEWKGKQEAEVKARLDLIAAAQKREAQNKVDMAAVGLVEAAFAAELKKPVTEQSFAPLNEALAKLGATLEPESAGKAAIASLEKRMETQRWIAEAVALRSEKPVPVTDTTPIEPKDPLERFKALGWLRYEPRLAAAGVYYIEKGGRRQCLLSCNSARYDLALFVDREVGVLGPRRQPLSESLGVLDVERIEVLGTNGM